MQHRLSSGAWTHSTVRRPLFLDRVCWKNVWMTPMSGVKEEGREGVSSARGRSALQQGAACVCMSIEQTDHLLFCSHHVHTDFYLFLFDINSHTWTSVYPLTTETGRSLNHHRTEPQGWGAFSTHIWCLGRILTPEYQYWFWQQSRNLFSKWFQPSWKPRGFAITDFYSRDLQDLFYCRGPLTFLKSWTEVIFLKRHGLNG